MLHNSHGPWESHLFQLVQHEYTTWSMSQYLIHILRVPKERTLAPSRSLYPVTTWSSELHLSLMVRHLKVQLLACLMKLYICNQTDQPFFPLKKKKICSPGRCWMDALELALSCSSLYKLTAKAGKEGDISTTSESSHILNLLQSTALTDTELLQ